MKFMNVRIINKITNSASNEAGARGEFACTFAPMKHENGVETAGSKRM